MAPLLVLLLIPAWVPAAPDPRVLLAAAPPATPPARQLITFNQQIAPILYAHCAVCHRPGQSAPFSLLTYKEAAKRSSLIAKVTAARIMPPWLPAPGVGDFAGARALGPEELQLIQDWVSQGAPEGTMKPPPLPSWNDDWALGQPDLILKLPAPYLLLSEGPDVYRSFVLPTSLSSTRYVEGFEFQPGNPKVTHHAVIQIDRTQAARALDQRDPEPGYPGFMAGSQAQLPDGQFLGWTPGKRPARSQEISWRLDPGTDLVVQLHLRASGKPEPVSFALGLYFADKPPLLHPYSLVLRNKMIDLPAGASGQMIEASYTFPVGVYARTIYPHAHYLAREMRVSARLPDDTEKALLQIDHWDFNWQEEYRYVAPIFLPKGSTISFQYSYDNSAENPRNPSQPPRRVVYGPNSTDEMAELLLQVLPEHPEELVTLRNYSAYQELVRDIALHEQRAREHPDNVQEWLYIAERCLQIGAPEKALPALAKAVEINPRLARARYLFGDALAQMSRFDEALPHLEEAVRLDPDNPACLIALSKVLSIHPNIKRRDPARAIRLASRAASLTAGKNLAALDALADAYAANGQFQPAAEAAQRALALAEMNGAQEAAEQIRRKAEGYRERQAKGKR